MLYPNIELMYKDELFLFTNYTQIKMSHHPIEKNDPILQRYIKKDYAVLVLSQDLSKYKKVCKYLRKKNIKEVIFVIDDVFRLNYKNYCSFLETDNIERDIQNVDFLEIQIIKNIINEADISKYKIFHCEVIPRHIQKFLGVKIEYYDRFLAKWLDSRYWNREHETIKNNNPSYKVSTMSNRWDYHRTLISAFFYDNKDFSYTMCEKPDIDKMLKQTTLDLNKINLHVNYDYKQKLAEFLKQPCKSLDNEYIYQDNGEMFYTQEKQESLDPFIHTKNSYVHLINETRFASPMQYISEKTFKPMFCKRPFVMLGPPGNLSILKKWGFKTFDKWWDESYDLETDHVTRLIAVKNIIETILKTDKNILDQMLYDMQDVIQHNDHHWQTFTTEFYNKLD